MERIADASASRHPSFMHGVARALANNPRNYYELKMCRSTSVRAQWQARRPGVASARLRHCRFSGWLKAERALDKRMNVRYLLVGRKVLGLAVHVRPTIERARNVVIHACATALHEDLARTQLAVGLRLQSTHRRVRMSCSTRRAPSAYSGTLQCSSQLRGMTSLAAWHAQ